MPQIIITCPPGFEYPIVDEALSLGAVSAKEGLMQVIAEMEWRDIYRYCLWSRLANRVLLPIKQFEANDDDELYEAIRELEWSIHLSPEDTFAVDFVSRRSNLEHEQFGALRIKDAIVDYFKSEFGERPNVDTDQPNVRVHCRINKNMADLCIDLSGKGLHQRGYRQQSGAAPLRENFAALMLTRSGWGATTHFNCLIDPMCGSGTIAIEAAQMKLQIAPGLSRAYWGFSNWKLFNEELFNNVLNEAKELANKCLEKLETSKPLIVANDRDQTVLDIARQNAKIAGVEDLIRFSNEDFSQLVSSKEADRTLVISNPPYGERLSDQTQAEKLYKNLGIWLRSQFEGQEATLLAATKEQGHALGIRAKKVYRLKNGPIDVELLKLVIEKKNFVAPREAWTFENYQEGLNSAAQGLLNRLKKNLASLKSFLNQHHISCFRLYDSDLPDYNVAIDIYEDAVHIQEYAPPKNIDPSKAKRRLKDVERVVGGLLKVPAERISIKTRMRQKGLSQYEANESSSSSSLELVAKENGVDYWVNLTDYLDTGLFIDHRKARQQLADWSNKQTQLLNLFCYTATGSIPAAKKGAKTTNVDLSNTYLNWAKRNFSLNKIPLDNQAFVRENCIDFLTTTKQRYDIIFVDPPTFSNSKKLTSDFDIQTSHVELIDLCVRCLNPNGKILFSNNFRKFDIQYVPSGAIEMIEFTRKTTSRDFSRRPLHKSWLITRK